MGDSNKNNYSVMSDKDFILERFERVFEQIEETKTISELHYKSIQLSLEEIQETLRENSKRVSELEKKEMLHIINCPNIPKIKKLEDMHVGNSAVKKHWLAVISILISVSTLVTFAVAMFKN